MRTYPISVLLLLPLTIVFSQFDRPYFHFHTELLSYEDAVWTCTSEGRFLLELSTTAKQADVVIYLRDIEQKAVWIGVSRRQIPNDTKPWEWRLESTHAQLGNVSFWGTGEPNNHEDKKERCVNIDDIDFNELVFNWNDRNCDEQLPFICVDWKYLYCNCDS